MISIHALIIVLNGHACRPNPVGWSGMSTIITVEKAREPTVKRSSASQEGEERLSVFYCFLRRKPRMFRSFKHRDMVKPTLARRGVYL